MAAARKHAARGVHGLPAAARQSVSFPPRTVVLAPPLEDADHAAPASRRSRRATFGSSPMVHELGAELGVRSGRTSMLLPSGSGGLRRTSLVPTSSSLAGPNGGGKRRSLPLPLAPLWNGEGAARRGTTDEPMSLDALMGDADEGDDSNESSELFKARREEEEVDKKQNQEGAEGVRRAWNTDEAATKAATAIARGWRNRERRKLLKMLPSAADLKAHFLDSDAKAMGAEGSPMYTAAALRARAMLRHAPEVRAALRFAWQAIAGDAEAGISMPRAEYFTMMVRAARRPPPCCLHLRSIAAVKRRSRERLCGSFGTWGVRSLIDL